MIDMTNKVIRKGKWFILGFFVFINSLIVFESSLPGYISSQRSSFITMIASFFINGITPDQQPDIIEVTGLEVKDYQQTAVQENSHYAIPVGVTRHFTVQVLPLEATNSNITWKSSNNEVLRVTSGGYLEARQLGENIKISVTSESDQDIVTNFYVDVIPRPAPANFEVNFDTSDLMVGYSRRLMVELDEQSQREYDTSLLTYTSSHPEVATINNYGVVNALSPGVTNITISDHEKIYSLKVVANPTPVVKPTAITLEGPDQGYVYGYTPLSYTMADDVTDPSVTFISSNEAIAKVDQNGVVYGSKVSGTAIIRVYANADFHVYDEHIINIVDVLPTHLTLTASSSEIIVAKKVTIFASLTHDLDPTLPVTNQEVIFTSSDENIAEVVSLNGQGIVLGKKRGTVTITATSEANPQVTATIDIQVLAIEVINEDNVQSFSGYIRKAVGHFFLFFINGLLGALTFILFIKENLIIKGLFSLLPGVFFAGLSEFIQYFVEGRGASVFDVLINIAGYLLGVICMMGLTYLTNRRRAQNLRKLHHG